MREIKQNIHEERELIRQSDISEWHCLIDDCDTISSGEWHCFIDDDDTISSINTKEDKTFFKLFTFVVLLLVCISAIACIFLSQFYN